MLVDSSLLTISYCLSGSTATFSFVCVPTILDAPKDKDAIALWRRMYVLGYRCTPPQCAVVFALWSVLAYRSKLDPAVNSPQSFLLSPTTCYTLAAVITPSIIPFTVTLQRALNGALCRKFESLVGPGSGTTAESFAGHDIAQRYENAWDKKGGSVKGLIAKWGDYNWLRAGINAVGTVVGTCGALMAMS